MTISANDRKTIYVGNGATTVFSYDFPVSVNTDLLVSLKNASNVYVVQTLTTNYTATTGPSGGNVTFLMAPTNGFGVIIESRTPRTQATDYVEGDRFPANTHEAALDKLTKIDQEQDEKLSRTLKIGPDLTIDPTLSSTSAGYIVRVNSTNTGIEAVAPELAGAITDVVPVSLGGTGASTASNARSNLGLAIGTNVQAYDAGLNALSGLTPSANTFPYYTGPGTAALTNISPLGRSIIDDTSLLEIHNTLELTPDLDIQTFDSNLQAISDTILGANQFPYFTSTFTAAPATLTPFARTLLDDSSASTARTTLGVSIGADVQAFDTTLASLATYNTNGLLTQTAVDTFTGRTLTGTFDQITVTNGDGVSGNPTLTLPIAVVLPTDASNSSSIAFSEQTSTGSNVVKLQAPNSITSNVTFRLPGADGTAGQVLKTDGSANLSFVTVSATAGGSDTQIQYNSTGSLAGSSWLTYNGTNAITYRNGTSAAQINIGSSTNGGFLWGGEAGCAIAGNNGGAYVQAYAGANGQCVYQTQGTGDHIFRVAGSATAAMILNAGGRLQVGSGTGDEGGSLNVRAVAGTNVAAFRSGVGQTNGTVYFNPETGGAVGSIGWNLTTTAFNTSSDYRLKHQVVPMENSLASILRLKPCTYLWKINNSIGEGFLAHELQEEFPLAVTGNKDALNPDGSAKHQSVDPTKIIGRLVSAVQELSAQNDNLCRILLTHISEIDQETRISLTGDIRARLGFPRETPTL